MKEKKNSKDIEVSQAGGENILQIQTLGGLSIRRDDVPVNGFPTRKAQALLVFLACNPKPHNREILAEMLWNDRSQRQSLSNLRVLLFHLRKNVNPHIVIEHDTVFIRADGSVQLDVDELEALLDGIHNQQDSFSPQTAERVEEALELYQGRFLDGFYVRDCRIFQEWVLVERERLHFLVVDALQKLVEWHVSQGAFPQAIQQAGRLLQLDPLSEAAYRQMMIALYQNGQRTEALTFYQTCCQRLQQELEVSPSAETEATYQAILNSELPRQVPISQISAPVRLPPNNLPAQLTSFIGREKELADVIRFLKDTHVLTLTGAGGTGKTRLSIRSAIDMLPQYPDGVWLVDLAPILDPLLVPRTTAITIGLRDEPQRPVMDMLCDYLSDKKMLIILDNCEHLVEACARMADRILHTAPDVRILATSRESLGIEGEVTYFVPSLGIPDGSQIPSVEALSQYEAVQLFIDRATSALPTFSITDENASALAEVCYRLDGIPLAIELAAAKIRVLSLEQIAERLDDRFRLLTGGLRTALERHQTLRAAVDWSYNLLPPEEQTLFRRLSVFVGGWTLEAAESVCGEDTGSGGVRSDVVLDLLEQLINKSLVVTEEEHGELRYRMLETIRQYAHEKRVKSGEGDMLRDRHLEYFSNLAENAEPRLRNAEQVEWLNRLDAEYENLRTALTWAIDLPLAESALRLAGALGIYWDIREYWLEGANWLDAVLSREWDSASKAEKSARAKVLYHRAKLADNLDELELGRSSAETALALCTEVGDMWGIAYSRALVAVQLSRMGNYQAAKSVFDRSLSEFQNLEDAWGEAIVLGWMSWTIINTEGKGEAYLESRGQMAALAERSGAPDLIAASLRELASRFQDGTIPWEQAERQLREAEQIYKDLSSSYGINRVRDMLAMALFSRGDLAQAKETFQLALEHHRQVGNRFMQGHSSLYLCLIAEATQEFDQAVTFGRQAAQIVGELGNPVQRAICTYCYGWSQYRQGDRENALQIVRQALVILKQSGELIRDDFDNQYFLILLSGFFVEERPQVTVKLLALTAAVSLAHDYPRYSLIHKLYIDRFLACAREKLSEAEFAPVWEVGLKMTMEEAVELGFKTLEKM